MRQRIRLTERRGGRFNSDPVQRRSRSFSSAVSDELTLQKSVPECGAVGEPELLSFEHSKDNQTDPQQQLASWQDEELTFVNSGEMR